MPTCALLALPLLVVLDEATSILPGSEGEASRIAWVRWTYDNLVVLRTFSKLAGLAGTARWLRRLSAWLLPHMWKIKQPYNINVAASLAALAALQDRAWLEEKVAPIVEERERMVAELARF